MDHAEWLASVTNGDSGAKTAEKIGLSESTLRSQLKRNKCLPADYVLLVADAYDVHPVQALADTGYIDQRYVNPHVNQLTNGELLEELGKRMR